MHADDLKNILASHAKWLNGERGGQRANLTRANLTGADLYGAYLTDADLSGADLSGANLTRADLTDADLSGANLTRANLTDADLTRADLTDADLSGANLTRANLTDADLSGANLTRADLTRANLTGAYLSGADLSGANLTGAYLTDANLTDADLSGADLSGAKLGARSILPSEGAFIAWKRLAGGVIAKLEIIGARVSPYTERKCRTDKARVLEIFGVAPGTRVRSMYDPHFFYSAGSEVSVPDANLDPRVVCTEGIHFFLTREEAEKYD